ncbi:MAG: DsbA family protein [Patescibacteria group bacterium]|nr:DsbA family protein [Patescibacteria group bacterium]
MEAEPRDFQLYRDRLVHSDPRVFQRPPRRRLRLGRTLLWGAGAVSAAVIFALTLAAFPRLGQAVVGVFQRADGQPASPSPLPAFAAAAAGANRPTLGSPDAPVVVVVFEDYQCPACREAVPVVDRVLQLPQFQGKVRFTFRHFPLPDVHPQAIAAARAAECAFGAGKFFPMRQLLFTNQDRLSAADLATYAERLGLDRAAFGRCLQSDASYTAVEQDWQAGLELEVAATPTFFIGQSRLAGAPTFAQLQQAIAAQLTPPLP